MNCFEARNDFIAFWQKTLADEHRAQLLTHLRQCASCNRSFRIFALSAPVLYSVSEPDIGGNVGGLNLLRDPSTAEQRPVVRKLNRLLPALAMAAAAAIALYFAAPPRMTFEDAIAADNSNVELASYPSADSFFGQELMAGNAAAPDMSNE